MKNQQIHVKNTDGKVIKGLFALGGTWAAIFLPVVLVILAFIIPFGDAITRSYILKIANKEIGKVFLFLMISLPIWCGLQQILSILHERKIYPKREKLLTFGLALAWTLHAIYILFIRM
ncbi:MAG: fumarate reductase subunit D [Gilliamella sp.]|uniref:fumarate reductase subunit FrdD n=1 Tax=Gilliamella sp. TaxID=1891236 RepID=UPI0025E53A55|nr:fumarate reductase subunit FrdD [Gilliamella sp.]MCO6538596.1 fumarate reductase subunit D [Gilliamella sp.]